MVPMIPESSWNRITNWYVAKAPAPAKTPSRNDQIPIGMPDFKVVVPKQRRDPPFTTMVQIDAQERVVFTADANAQALDVLGPTGDLLVSSPVGNIITTLQRSGDDFYVGGIGHFFPNEEPRGQVFFLKRTEKGLDRHWILPNLPRVAHIELGDFNKVENWISRFRCLVF